MFLVNYTYIMVKIVLCIAKTIDIRIATLTIDIQKYFELKKSGEKAFGYLQQL